MFIILVSIVSLQLKSQDIVVSYKIDKLGVYKFSATNSSQRPYFVVMNFTNLIGNLSEITGTVHRVEHGVKQL